MRWTSILAIYFLFWVMTAFLLLPFDARTDEEAGTPKIPGQADSAPSNFRAGRLAIRATVISAAVTALYVVNYSRGWITRDSLDVTKLFG